MLIYPPTRLSSGKNRQRNPHDGGRFMNARMMTMIVRSAVAVIVMMVMGSDVAAIFAEETQEQRAKHVERGHDRP